MQCAVFETSHDKFYGDAVLWNGKLVGQRSNHQICHFERRRYFFAPIGLSLLQVIEHADANGKRAVILDNRGERPGAMFADWELVGVPHRVVLGDRGLKDGQVEYQGRRDAAAQSVALGDIAAFVKARLGR